MNFLQRIIRGAEYRSGLAVPEAWLTDAIAGPRSSAGERVTVKSAFGLAPVFAAVQMISEAVGRMPLKVYREMADASDENTERVEARQHRAWRMLHDAPNPSTPADRFWSTVTAQLLLYGNVFALKNRTDGFLVDELYLLDPSQTSVYWDDVRKVKTFVQEPANMVGASQTGRKTWTEDEVLHIFGLSLNGIVGVSRIEWCRNMLGNVQAREKFEGGFWDRGAAVSGVLQRPLDAPELGEEGLSALRAEFQAVHGSAARKGWKVPVLEEGTTFQTVGMPLRDAQFVEANQLTRTDIAVLFNLPPNYLGGSSGDSLTYATVEANQLQFVQHAVMPWTNTIEKALVADPSIFPQNVYFPEFVIEALLRADAGARAEYYTKMAALKAMTVNEIRARENMPPLPGGDEIGSAIPEQARETIQDPAAAVGGTGAPSAGTLTAAQVAALNAGPVPANGKANGKPPVAK